MSLMDNLLLVDAENMIFGRLASIVAKRLLNGERIVVINVEKAVLSGRKSSVLKDFKSFFEVKTLRNPVRGPKRDRFPDRLFRNAVRGMLPKHNSRGLAALRRLRVYIGCPEEFKGLKATHFREADASRLGGSYIYLGDVAKELGWKGV